MEDLPSLRQAVTIMLRLVTAFALLFTIATILTPTGILWIYTKDAEIIEYGAIYLRWLIPTYLCMGLSLTCTIVLRSVGQVQIPLISSILAFFINVFFNWVFIFGRLGAPRMEIAGAALGTLIARAFEFFFICGYFFFRDRRIAYRLHHLGTRCRALLGEYLRVSIPVLISDSLLALGNNAVAMIMGHIGAPLWRPIPSRWWCNSSAPCSRRDSPTPAASSPGTPWARAISKKPSARATPS